MAFQKKQMRQNMHWPLIWLLQAAAAFILGGLAALSVLLGTIVHGACLWGLFPLIGFALSLAATHRGLNNYLAWLAPPTMEVLANLLIWGYVPSAAPILLCGFLSLMGAATGEVLKRQNKGER